MINTVDTLAFLSCRPKVPIIDVRSPGEFADGHIPGALNVPLFTNDERALVGTSYKEKGPDKALLLGLDIVGPKMSQIASDGKRYAGPGGTVAIHCWRGGKRSGSVGWLLSTAGLDVQLLEGGYKAYRSVVLQFFEKCPIEFIVVGGRTGSRKTAVLHELQRRGEQVVDLEGLANHKGSAFGWINESPQPTTQQFENNLYDLLSSFDPDRPRVDRK